MCCSSCPNGHTHGLVICNFHHFGFHCGHVVSFVLLVITVILLFVIFVLLVIIIFILLCVICPYGPHCGYVVHFILLVIIFCRVGCSLHPFGLDLHGLFFSHDLIVLLITYTPQQYPIPLFLLLLVNCLFKVVVNVLQHVILFDVEPLPIVSPSFELLLFSKGSPPYSQMGELTFCLENYGEIFACYCATTPAN